MPPSTYLASQHQRQPLEGGRHARGLHVSASNDPGMQPATKGATADEVHHLSHCRV